MTLERYIRRNPLKAAVVSALPLAVKPILAVPLEAPVYTIVGKEGEVTIHWELHPAQAEFFNSSQQHFKHSFLYAGRHCASR